MIFNTFFYSLKQGVKNIWRNKTFSLASIATMGACIFMFGLFFILIENFGTMVKAAEEGVAITVFFDEGMEESAIETIGEEQILTIKGINKEKSRFVTADEAWETFKESYFEGKEHLAEGFTENPLANSANYEIYLDDISNQSRVVTAIEKIDGVREVKKSEEVANTLTDFNKLISYISVGIILILLCVAVFLISNTVTVGITVRKEEIAIMKLIGATDYLVRAPFVFEGITIGLIGASIPLVLLYFLYEKIVVYIGEKFNFIGSMLNFIPANKLFNQLIPIALILGVGIGFLGSKLTIRKHLKV